MSVSKNKNLEAMISFTCNSSMEPVLHRVGLSSGIMYGHGKLHSRLYISRNCHIFCYLEVLMFDPLRYCYMQNIYRVYWQLIIDENQLGY